MESILEARHQFRSEQPRLIKQLGVQCERVDSLIREGDPDAVHATATRCASRPSWPSC